MNIHITDIELFEKLALSTIFSIEIGSKMYGLDNDFSDRDIICVYATSDNELNSFHMTHHQIQYKENNTDYIFVNIHNFIRNCLTGDSTINMEVICNEKLKGTCLEFLYNMRYSFYNYKILKSYLGLCKRDLTRIDIDGKTEYTKNKKIAHAYRGLLTAEKIFLNKDIQLSDKELNTIKTDIWTLNGYIMRQEYSNKLMSQVDILRNNMNKELDKKNITNFMTIENQNKLQLELNKLTQSNFYMEHKMDNFNMELIYDANENGIKY